MKQWDVIIIGAGLAGLAAAHQATVQGQKVLLLDQEGPQSLGGQAFWSLGGLFMVDTPEQRRMGIRDCHELATNDWMGSAGFDRVEDANPRKVAAAYLDYAAGPMRSDLAAIGMRWFSVVGWAERGGALATGHGNSVPRFHITWGAGEGVVAPYVRLAQEAEAAGFLTFGFRHRVTGLDVTGGRVTGVRGDILAEDAAMRGASTNQNIISKFKYNTNNMIITSNKINKNFNHIHTT